MLWTCVLSIFFSEVVSLQICLWMFQVFITLGWLLPSFNSWSSSCISKIELVYLFACIPGNLIFHYLYIHFVKYHYAMMKVC